MDENHPFRVLDTCTSFYVISETIVLLLLVLLHGFGSRFFRIAISILVRAHLADVSKFVHLPNDCVVFSRMPFECNTPINYLFAFTLQYLALTYMYLFGAFIISLEIGWYLMVMAFIGDIKNDIRSIATKMEKHHSEISTILHNSIDFHSCVKQLRP